MKRSSVLRQCVEEFERRYIYNELLRNHWNRAQTARELGITYRALLYKLDRFQLSSPQTDLQQAS